MILPENDKFYEVDIDTNGSLGKNILKYVDLAWKRAPEGHF